MKNDKLPWDWNAAKNDRIWHEPCEESHYYAYKWKNEGRRSVLDLGCGLGRHALLFAKCGFKTTAIDISPDAIDYIRKIRTENGVDILAKRGDMTALPFNDDAFDCIFAMHSAGHCDTQGMKQVLGEIRRTLKPDGAVFLTLCSKESETFANKNFPHTDENTVIKTEGPEQGVPHFFADRKLIEELFTGFELVKVRHIDDCYYDGSWKNQKHYFIEATAKKEPHVYDFSDIIGRKVHCSVDRPLGTAHPRFADLVYPINYGYVDNVMGGDGAEQDVYILGVDEPLEKFDGVVEAVYHRHNDNEDKWIVVPDGMQGKFTKEYILEKIEFQEKFFDGELYFG
ncbi:MAG: methyltransferase domain-containing protein [Oscillospiraceae bacterium]|nr:methyltransferase domain-containing protein [Oscillospiraceae bacterium]